MSKHFDELTTLVSSLGTDFSVIGLTETKFSSSVEPSINYSLPNYSVIQTPSDSSAGGSLLYVSDRLNFKPRNDLSSLMNKSSQLESTFIEIIYNKKKNILIGCIYKHPKMSIDEFNNKHLYPVLRKAHTEKKTLLILGDFNINLLQIDSENSVSSFLDMIGSFALLPQVIYPTRITSNSRTLIDNIFFDSSNVETFSGNLTWHISDHLPQFLFIKNMHPNKKIKFNLQKRNWNHFKHEDFILDYLEIDWDETLNLEAKDTNLSFEIFLSKMNDLLDKHAQMEKLTRKQFENMSKPWLTPGIKQSINKRNKYHKLLVSTKDPVMKKIYEETFKIYRNLIVTLTRKSKNNHYSNYFSNNMKNLKKVWSGINDLISSRKNKRNSPSSIYISKTELTSDPSLIANQFNDYFTTVADNLRSKIVFSKHIFTDFLKNCNSKSIFISPTDQKEVASCISSLKLNKSNSIHPKILTLLLEELSIILAKLINLSFSTGCFPDVLKTAKVIPFFKKDSSLEVSNYRPISLLSNIDKIIEKLMYARVIKFLEQSKSIYSMQFGFRKKHSTIDTLINITEAIRIALDTGKFACGIFVDLQKAFDTVDHNILLRKLDHYGIRGLSNSWFKSYLSNRKQFVSILGFNSIENVIKHGVPQGSVLGPLLFLLYINYLHVAIKNSLVHHFADDTNLLMVDKSLKSLQKKVNFDLKMLNHWLNANKICLNAKKTEYVLFHSNKNAIRERNFIKVTS